MRTTTRPERPVPNDVTATMAPAVGAFRSVLAACAMFFVLTIAAMFLYPGGRVGDTASVGYAFFANFFSDLGQTRTYSGASNLPSLALFCIALFATAVGIGIFFIAFARLFPPASPGRRLGAAGAVCGVITGVCFIGVACTPWNLYLRAHNDFVQWAFRAFLLAMLCNTAAVLLTPNFPRRFAWMFGTFAVLLAAYVALLVAGPRVDTPSGALVQATGQKLIVYASVLTIAIASASIPSDAKSKRSR